jgi:hypothetical protein
MDNSSELDDLPDPFFRRRSTWVVAFLGCAVLAIAGWWWMSDSTTKSIVDLGSRQQYDSAWSRLRASQGSMGDCERLGLEAHLAQLDTRVDSALQRIADSLKACRVPVDSVLELVTLGDTRILEHAKGLDSSKQWALQANAFRAASDCIKADSLNRNCQLMGFQALVGMKDTYGQVAWIKNALIHWPSDTALLSRQAQAVAANNLVKTLPVAPAPEPAKPIKPVKKKHKH